MFDIILDDAIYRHFNRIDRKDRRFIVDSIEKQLTYEPARETQNRKPLRIPNTLKATWELRCGPNNRFRIFYDVDIESRIVVVLAVGRKIRDTLWIGDEEIRL